MRRQRTPDKAIQKEPEWFSTNVARARRFYLDLRPDVDSRLAVVCGGLEHCTPDYAIHRPTFPFYKIEYVAGGRGKVKLKGHSYPLEAGRLFAYVPGAPQDITSDAGEPLIKYFVNFVGRTAGRLLEVSGLASGRVSQVHPPYALQILFDDLIESGLRGRRQRTELCVKLLECLTLKISGSGLPLEDVDTLALNTYETCRQYMERHFARLASLEQLARECHINDAYLCRLFRRYDHQSPYRYLLQLKMNLAAERLQQPGSLIKQVAEDIGFRDPFHFSRVFKSFFGIAPGAFRGIR